MWCDSHCHLHLIDCERKPERSLDDIVTIASERGVAKMLNVATTLEQTPTVIALAERYSNVWTSVGLHPNDVDPILQKNPQDGFLHNQLIEYASLSSRIVALGETGLDYYRLPDDDEDAKKRIIKQQKQSFIEHLSAAKALQKPVIIHTRQAQQDTMALLKEHGRDVRGVFHCFTEDYAMAKKALDLGYFISFSGIITFKNAVELQNIVKKIPLEHLLIETDTPYLAPVPYRGKSNEPAYVIEVGLFLATLKKTPAETVASITTQNAEGLFSF
jgi:TatD DNase family protein